MNSLYKANVGEKVTILKNDSLNSVRNRLYALGLTEGTIVEVLRKGPKDNLTLYNVRGAMIALRNDEVEHVYF